MKVPPYAVAVRVAEPERTRFCAWLPLFILWPLLLALVLLALVVTVVVDTLLVLAGRRYQYTRFVVGCLEVVGETRGVEIFVRDECRTVAMTIR
jgi:hypothetical protein